MLALLLGTAIALRVENTVTVVALNAALLGTFAACSSTIRQTVDSADEPVRRIRKVTVDGNREVADRDIVAGLATQPPQGWLRRLYGSRCSGASPEMDLPRQEDTNHRRPPGDAARIPVKVVYTLTKAGKSALPVVLAAKQWAESNFRRVLASRDRYDRQKAGESFAYRAVTVPTVLHRPGRLLATQQTSRQVAAMVCLGLADRTGERFIARCVTQQQREKARPR